MDGQHASTVNRASAKLFVSHSGFDKPIVRAIASQLRAFGYQVWLDENELVPGDRILSRIEGAVVEADFLVLFLSRAALESTWVDEEWRLKFEQQLGERQVSVIPVLLEDVFSLPPVLRGRLHISGSRAVLLRDAAKQIDRGVLELLRRRDGEAEGWEQGSLVGEVTVAKMRAELADALGASRLRWYYVTEILLSARAVAAAEYDSGDTPLATAIYDELLSEVAASKRFWEGCPELEKISGQIRGRVEKQCQESSEKSDGHEASGSISSRVWSARMVIDSVIDYAQAAAILGDFIAEAQQMKNANPPWLRAGIFEPLRYAVHGREDKIELLSPSMLDAVCAVGLEVAEPLLERLIRSEEGEVDLRLAATLRMCRGGLAPRGRAQAPDPPRRTAVEVVEDVLYLDMMSFDTQSFAMLGDLGKEFDSLVDRGAVAVFDRGLANRGYPRDADYWEEGALRYDGLE